MDNSLTTDSKHVKVQPALQLGALNATQMLTPSMNYTTASVPSLQDLKPCVDHIHVPCMTATRPAAGGVASSLGNLRHLKMIHHMLGSTTMTTVCSRVRLLFMHSGFVECPTSGHFLFSPLVSQPGFVRLVCRSVDLSLERPITIQLGPTRSGDSPGELMLVSCVGGYAVGHHN